MAKDDNLDFDDLKLPDDESAEPEPLDDLSFPDEEPAVDNMTADLPEEGTPDDAVELPDESMSSDDDVLPDDELGAPMEEGLGAAVGEEDEPAEEVADGKKSKKKKQKKTKAKKPKAEKAKKPKAEKEEGGPGVLEKIFSANVYTVMLAVSLLAMIIAVALLFAELNRYNRDIPATELKEKMGASRPVQLQSPSTTAVA